MFEWFSHLVKRKSGNYDWQEKVFEPLLSEPEINQLLRYDKRANANHSQLIPQSGQSGNLLSENTGSGSDFSEVREYQIGDESRHIDWRATARSQQPLVKTFHQQFSRSLCLVIDRRCSMRFATKKRLKATQALRAAIWTLAQDSLRDREVMLVILDKQNIWLSPVAREQGIQHLIKQGNKACPPCFLAPTINDRTEKEITKKGGINNKKIHQQESWNTVLSKLIYQVPKGSDVVLISDFYNLKNSDKSVLQMLAHHCQTQAIQVLDSSEINSPQFLTPLQLVVNDGALREYHYSIANKLQFQDFNSQLQADYQRRLALFEQANIQRMSLSVEVDDFPMNFFSSNDVNQMIKAK